MCTRTVCLITFGCKVNQYDGQAIREELVRQGLVPWEEVQDGADAYVVNTCTVTDTAYREGLRTARKLRRDNPDALIVVTGCAADSNADDFRKIGGVSVFGNQDKPGIAGFLAGKLAAPKPLSISRFADHSRAFMKVQDGCDLSCSFCIIPTVRGANKSRPFAESVEEAERLVASGYREVVLTGVHLGSFGKDRSRRSELSDLIKRLLQIPDLARVRLSSIEINEVSEELIELMRSEPWRLCPHLHVPVQSGSDPVLQAMRRRYNVAQFLRTVDRLREALPDPSFTTDVIVGFPTETESDFETTVDFCRRVGFNRIHVFPYSPRQGTDAAALKDLAWDIKKDRLHRLEQVGRELAASYASRFVGRDVQIVVEGAGRGYTERYVPARFTGGSPGSLLHARGLRVEEGALACGAK